MRYRQIINWIPFGGLQNKLSGFEKRAPCQNEFFLVRQNNEKGASTWSRWEPTNIGERTGL